MPSRTATNEAFDQAYFDRFYESKRTRVQGAAEVANLAQAITGLYAWWSAPLTSVLDVGAGPGLLRDWFRTHRKSVRYTSTDVSAYACERYGHERRDITRWRSTKRFDLVFCQGVLPYIDDEGVGTAIENLAAMCRGFLYLEAITQRDLDTVCDRSLTDVAVHERPASFYLRLLEPHFEEAGCGLYHRRGGPARFYELEAPGVRTRLGSGR
ncbi:hypothetical protein BH09MYX1_BH09MYX1_26520 [soil metagenome]